MASDNFDKLPKEMKAVNFLLAMSAVLVVLLGLGITGQAMLQILATN